MATNNDPDETVLLDYGLFRVQFLRLISRDGLIDPVEQEALDAFDRTHRTHGKRYHAWRNFTSLMRNGLTRRTALSAKEAGIAIVIGDDNYPVNVIPFPASNPQSA